MPGDSGGRHIAFCIFGQIRDEHLSFPKTAEIARKHKAQVFISVWAKRGTKTLGATAIPQLTRMFGREVAHAMPRLIQTHFYTVFPELDKEMAPVRPPITESELRAYFPDAVIDIEDEHLHLGFEPPHHQTDNSLRMLYRMWRCHRIMRQHEHRTGLVFETVVQFRPDLVPPEEIPYADPDTLYVPGGLKPNFLHDMLACGQTKSVGVLVSAFGHAASNATRPWGGIHGELAKLAQENGLTILPLEPSQAITEDLARARENRSLLMHRLGEGRYDRQLYAAEEWDRVANVLAIAAKDADGDFTGEDRDRLLELLREPGAHVAREAALSVLSTRNEKQGRVRDAVVLEVHRVLCAMQGDGLHVLGAHLFQDVIFRLKSLLARLPRFERLDIAELLRAAEDEPLGEDARLAVCAVERFIDPELREKLESRIGRVRYPDVGDLSKQFWRLTSDPATRTEAEAIGLRMVETNPLDFRGYDHLGHYHFQNGDLDKALQYAIQALDTDRMHWGLWTRAAFIYSRLGERDLAYKHLLGALTCRDGRIVRDHFPEIAKDFAPEQKQALEHEWERRYGRAGA